MKARTLALEDRPTEASNDREPLEEEGWRPYCIVCKKLPAVVDGLWCEKHSGWTPAVSKDREDGSSG